MLLSKGKGKPIDRRSQRNQTTQVAQYLVPDVATAATNYEGICPLGGVGWGGVVLFNVCNLRLVLVVWWL